MPKHAEPISEAPTSAEAVKPTPSIEVGEMVERLKEIDEQSMYLAPATTHAIVNEAASLLLSLDAERGRLRTALKPLLDHYVQLASSGDCGFWDPEKDPEVIAARSALGGV